MLPQNTILLVDDDNDVLQAYQTLLEMEGYQTVICNDPSQIVKQIPDQWQGVIISDIYMPQLSGWELLTLVQEKDKSLPVILITGHGDVPMAIEAVQKGAFYFIEKPINPEHLLKQLALAYQTRADDLLRRHNHQQLLQKQIIGQSQWAKQLRIQLQQLAETDVPTFIFGETGTGKHLVGEYLHQLSIERFPHKQILELNAPHTAEQLTSKLPIHFTGTFILHNIEYLDVTAQKALIQYIHLQKNKVRVVLISQYTLNQLLNEFQLIPELFYLLSLTQLECVPLSQRGNDIELLFRHFLQIACQKMNKKRPPLSETWLKQLHTQTWIGNIHQLIHTAELYAAGISVKQNRLTANLNEETGLSLDDLIETYEKQLITEALDRFQGKINDVADYLKVPRKKLYLRMKKYGLDKAEYKPQ